MSNDYHEKTIVLRKKNAKPTSASGLAKARESGAVESVRKFDAGSNKNSKTTPNAGINAAKIDAETEDFKVPAITQEFKVALMQARQAKGWTQAELAMKVAVKPSVISDYETGKGIPNQTLINSFNRVLGARLPKIPKKKKAAAASTDDS